MIEQKLRERIISLVHCEVVPAIGCTEPMSVALCTAKATLVMEGKCVSSSEGIVDDDVDKSIHNLTSIGADAMCKTDDMVLNIMTSKT